MKLSQNTGHGHVFPRPDGMLTRCGGPGICKECSADLARKNAAEPNRDELARRFARLSAAVRAIYAAAHWTADRPCDEDGLWKELRDAAGMAPGTSPRPRA